jgi:hypothetical protein
MAEISRVLRISGGQRRSFTVIDWCVTACVFAPFIIKRLVVLGEHDYVYWIAVDYAARSVSLVGLALAYRRGLMMPSHRRAGLVVSFVVLGALLVVQFAEQSLAYPFLRGPSAVFRILAISADYRSRAPRHRSLIRSLPGRPQRGTRVPAILVCPVGTMGRRQDRGYSYEFRRLCFYPPNVRNFGCAKRLRLRCSIRARVLDNAPLVDLRRLPLLG